MVILLFGAGTDYGLLLISRYREELRHEPDHRTALATALGETWEAIAASGLTVTLAVATLLFAYGEYRNFAPVLGVGVFVTLIAGAHAHAGAARRARTPRLLAAHAEAGRRDDASSLAAHRRGRGRGSEAGGGPRHRRPRAARPRLPLLQPALQLHRGLPQGHALEAGLRAARAALPQGRAGADDGALQGAAGAARVRHRHDHRRPQPEPRRRRRLPHRHRRRRQAAQLPGHLRGRPVLDGDARAGAHAARERARDRRRRRQRRYSSAVRPPCRPTPGRISNRDTLARGDRRPGRGRRDPGAAVARPGRAGSTCWRRTCSRTWPRWAPPS